jgi:uncharacterized protein
MWSHGHFHWNELMTRNPEQAKSFYGATVGWTFEAMPMPDGTGLPSWAMMQSAASSR